jgi:hypothetical protein
MSAALAQRPVEAAPAIPGGWAAIARHNAGKDNPMMLIPADWVDPVAVLWLANFHLLPSALALTASLRILAEHGLTTADAHALCRKLLEPGQRATHKFASDLIADMNATGAELIRRRKAAAETAARREPPPPNVAAEWNARRLAEELASTPTWNPEDCQ